MLCPSFWMKHWLKLLFFRCSLTYGIHNMYFTLFPIYSVRTFNHLWNPTNVVHERQADFFHFKPRATFGSRLPYNKCMHASALASTLQHTWPQRPVICWSACLNTWYEAALDTLFGVVFVATDQRGTKTLSLSLLFCLRDMAEKTAGKLVQLKGFQENVNVFLVTQLLYTSVAPWSSDKQSRNLEYRSKNWPLPEIRTD